MKDTWRFGAEELENLTEVLRSGDVAGMSGSANITFEKRFAECVGANYGITFNSGTSTLHAALEALNVGPGDEVIMPALTVIANLQVTIAQNAVPVFADVDPVTYNLNPTDVAAKVSSRTKAIMAVPLYGAPCEYDELLSLGIPIINDAAQAPLARYKGQPIGAICDITSFSFDATKHMTTGDGGMITTLSQDAAVAIRKFGCLGYRALQAGDGRVRNNKDLFQNPEYSRHDAIGLNYRMSEFQAAVGLAQLEKLQSFVNLRREIAKLYYDVCEGWGGLKPQLGGYSEDSAYWTFACRLVADDIDWTVFRKKFIQFGGSGIYAAWKLLYDEDVFRSGVWQTRYPEIYEGYHFHKCKVASEIQPQLMQFPLNEPSVEAAMVGIDALNKTINYYA